jgi:hypothetical protein
MRLNPIGVLKPQKKSNPPTHLYKFQTIVPIARSMQVVEPWILQYWGSYDSHCATPPWFYARSVPTWYVNTVCRTRGNCWFRLPYDWSSIVAQHDNNIFLVNRPIVIHLSRPDIKNVLFPIMTSSIPQLLRTCNLSWQWIIHTYIDVHMLKRFHCRFNYVIRVENECIKNSLSN